MAYGKAFFYLPEKNHVNIIKRHILKGKQHFYNWKTCIVGLIFMKCGPLLPEISNLRLQTFQLSLRRKLNQQKSWKEK